MGRQPNLDDQSAAVFEKKGITIIGYLNEGAFGEVYEGRMKNGKKVVKVAIKAMDLVKAGKIIENKFLDREIEALRSIEHPNVITIHDIWRANRVIYTVMEFAEDGDIKNYIKKTKPHYCDEHVAAYWFNQQVDALTYIHEDLHMAHRDIKVDNILLTSSKLISKMTDFGFATQCWDNETGQVKMSNTFCGTKPYQSYQIIKHMPYNPFAADCHAMGVTLFVMVNGHNLFPLTWNNAAVMLEEMTKGSYKKRYIEKAVPFSAELLDLIDGLMAVREDKRLTMVDVKKHRWIVMQKKTKPIK